MLARSSQLYYFIYLGHSIHHVFVLVNKHRIHYHLHQAERYKDVTFHKGGNVNITFFFIFIFCADFQFQIYTF